MTPSTPAVVTVVGGYRVALKDVVHFVSKQRRCSCGRHNCPAIQAVVVYLRAGGTRAPDAIAPPQPDVLTCPICQSIARGSLEKKDWMCSVDHSHFFLWRTKQLRAARAKALQSASPYKLEVLAAFASDEVRAEFLAAHSLTYAASA
jgi:hypothetical protein